MTKIIKKFIKDMNKSNTRNNYVFDFKNNYIVYKGIALYKADVSMFNYDWIVEHGYKEFDCSKFLEIDRKFIDCEKDGLCELEDLKGEKFLASVYHSYDYLVKVNTNLEKIINTPCYHKAYSNRTGVYYINKLDDTIEAYIMPIV